MHFLGPELNPQAATPNFTAQPAPQSTEPVMGAIRHPHDDLPSMEATHPSDTAEMIGTVSIGDVNYPDDPQPTKPAAPTAEETPAPLKPGSNEPPKPPTTPPKPTPGETPDERPGFSPQKFEPEAWDSYTPGAAETANAALDLSDKVKATIEKNIDFTDAVNPTAIVTQMECETPEGIIGLTLTVENGKAGVGTELYRFTTGASDNVHTYRNATQEGLPILRRNKLSSAMTFGDRPENGAVSASEMDAWGQRWEDENIPNMRMMDELGVDSKPVGADEAAHIAHYLDRAVPLRVGFTDINDDCRLRIQNGGPVTAEDSIRGAGEFTRNVGTYVAGSEQPVNEDGLIEVKVKHKNNTSVHVEVAPAPADDPQAAPFVHMESREPYISPDADKLRQQGIKVETRVTVEYQVKAGELWIAHAADVVVGERTIAEGKVNVFRGDTTEAQKLRNFLHDPTYRPPSRDKFDLHNK